MKTSSKNLNYIRFTLTIHNKKRIRIFGNYRAPIDRRAADRTTRPTESNMLAAMTAYKKKLFWQRIHRENVLQNIRKGELVTGRLNSGSLDGSQKLTQPRKEESGQPLLKTSSGELYKRAVHNLEQKLAARQLKLDRSLQRLMLIDMRRKSPDALLCECARFSAKIDQA